MLYNVLNFLLFIEIFQIFENFYPLFYSFGPFLTLLDRFLLIYNVGDPFQRRFDRCFDPFMSISDMMFKLAYRLGFTSVCILHDLMTVSL